MRLVLAAVATLLCASRVQADLSMALSDDFSSAPLSSTLWDASSTATVSSTCASGAQGLQAVFSGASPRQLVSLPLDLSQATTVSFFFSSGSPSGCEAIDIGDGPSIAYSLDGTIWVDFSLSPKPTGARTSEQIVATLPAAAQTTGVFIKFYQPQFSGSSSDYWGLDSLRIYGEIGATPTSMTASLAPQNPQQWVYTGINGQVGTYCSQSNALSFSGTNGVSLASTMPLDLSGQSSAYVQFEINVGCGASASLADTSMSVELQYQAPSSTTWNTVRSSTCAFSTSPTSGCSTFEMVTQYTTREYQTWQRVTVTNLPGGALSNGVRFRFVQVDGASASPTWGLGALYIGSECPSYCSGHGLCVSGTCSCDSGFSGTDCGTAPVLPSEIREDFTSSIVSASNFVAYSGVVPGSSNCGVSGSGAALEFTGAGPRLIETIDLDLRTSLMVSFFAQTGTGSFCSQSSASYEALRVAYSTDGGTTWVAIGASTMTPSSPTQVEVLLPAGAKTAATRIMIWQPYQSSSSSDEWAVDNLFIGGRPAVTSMTVSTFANPQQWVYTGINGQVGTYCSQSNALSFSGTNGVSLASTMPLDLSSQPTAFVQFEINVGCGASASLADTSMSVELQYQTPSSTTWATVRSTSCGFSTAAFGSSCTTFELTTIYTAREFKAWQRVTVTNLPGGALSNGVRFRFVQVDGTSAATTWGIRNVYIGSECPNYCSGHGRCASGTCSCDSGFSGSDCGTAPIRPSQIDDSFDTSLSMTVWPLQSSVSLSSECGVLTAGKSLFFSGLGPRYIVSETFDLRFATTVACFVGAGGSCNGPSQSYEALGFGYSTDGGVTWTRFGQTTNSGATTTKQIALALPSGAKTAATTIMIWQPTQSSSSSDEWALDSLYIGGDATAPGFTSLSSDFSPFSAANWIYLLNGVVSSGTICGVSTTALQVGTASTSSGMRIVQSRVLDLSGAATASAMIQFDLGMGCASSSLVPTANAITLQYSVSSSFATWATVSLDCTSPTAACSSPFVPESVYTSNDGYFQTFRRVTVPLPTAALTSSVSFRWTQAAASTFPSGSDFALDRVYIGDGCPQYCSGHGFCEGSSCTCDSGFSGTACEMGSGTTTFVLQDFSTLPTGTTNLGVQFGRLVGGSIVNTCSGSTLALTFGPVDTTGEARFVDTVDVDMTGSTAFNFTLLMGGTCERPDATEDVVLYYSTNGGVVWTKVATYAVSSYPASSTFYFITATLPLAAQKSATRFRWEQLKNSGASNDYWALGAVSIGSVTACSSNPCQNGAVCSLVGSSDYACTCASGFTGTTCDQQLTSCTSNPCLNGGVCSVASGSGAWQCSCATGYTGDNCASDIDECLSSPCSNGAVCLNQLGHFTCECAPGYTGVFCETDINECLSFPCRNSGACTNLVGSFSCTCTSGYGGPTCAVDLDDCLSSPCANGATCVNNAGSYTCLCATGFGGGTCAIEISDCNSNPCINGGSCASMQPSGYMCTCATGYVGAECQFTGFDLSAFGSKTYTHPGSLISIEIPANTFSEPVQVIVIPATPSVNGAPPFPAGVTFGSNSMVQVSIDPPTAALASNINVAVANGEGAGATLFYTANQVNPFMPASSQVARRRALACGTNETCGSIPGAGFVFAGVAIDECASSPCRNGATCTDSLNFYSCTCSSGFSGATCDVSVNECASSPCQNGATCVDQVDGFTCTCISGFSGGLCELAVIECVSMPCMNGATCVDGVNAYSCTCASGFSGTLCDQNVNECSSMPCHNGATCVDLVNEYSCTCVNGFSGTLCEQAANPCSSNPCVNGVCSEPTAASFSCACTAGFTGSVCDQDIDECASSPCGSGSVCSDRVNSYVCSAECASSPCSNGASCLVGIGTFECQCAAGFDGEQCETNINECTSEACPPIATCIDGVNSVVCVCPAGFTGAACDERLPYCDSSPCLNSGVCSEGGNGTCFCADGFTGALCETNIDECASSPCVTGACMDGLSSYACQCPSTATGSHCETTIVSAVCLSMPCSNGGACDATPGGGFTCVCPAAFTGTVCESVVDECESSPCHGVSSCVTSVGRFECVCAVGWTGTLCDVDIDECASSPCQNSGSCANLEGGYDCTCSGGFTGDECHLTVDLCSPLNPCKNGAGCSSGVNSFVCTCLPGYTGGTCQTNIDECASTPCANGGSCMDRVDMYECLCVSGFTGGSCEASVNECASTPCANGGTCVDGTSGYVCTCAMGFTGTTCSGNIDECGSSPCQNSRPCVDGNNGFTCNCGSAFSGTVCEVNVNECASAPCVNGGTCVDGTGMYTCTCASGFTGATCAAGLNECASNPCQNGGGCTDGVNGFTCACVNGFTGSVCDQDIDECGSSPCQNSGVCSGAAGGGFTCGCVLGTSGTLCQLNNDECASSPCVNGATCVDGINMFSCTCASGFVGARCASNVDECASAPCQNGGNCVDGTNSFSCSCVGLFSGTLCETMAPACSSNPCQGASTCTDTGPGFMCTCESMRTGTRCETDVGPCSSNPCANGGVCSESGAGYACACATGYTGSECAVDIDECASNPCRNGGACIEPSVGAYGCSCPAGYAGDQCETDIDECAAGATCPAGQTCQDLVNAFQCVTPGGGTGGGTGGQNSSSGLSMAVVIGAAVGGLLVLFLILFLIVFFRRRGQSGAHSLVRSGSEVSSISGAYGSAEGERVPPSRLASARGARPSSDAIRSMSGRQDASRETPSYEGAVVPGVKPLGSINRNSAMESQVRDGVFVLNPVQDHEMPTLDFEDYDL